MNSVNILFVLWSGPNKKYSEYLWYLWDPTFNLNSSFKSISCHNFLIMVTEVNDLSTMFLSMYSDK